MVKKITLFVLLLSVLVLSFANTNAEQPQEKRGKTKLIGKNTWYTEQNSFADIIKIAQKENKPVLAVFSATWCEPCRMVSREVFVDPGFQEIAKRVVLLYIEQTEPRAFAYLKQNRISIFPTFKIFSKDGIDLDTGSPRRSVEGFLQWIKDVEAGNHLYGLQQQLKKEPNNRDLILKIEERLRRGHSAGREELLRRAIALKPDFKNPVSHEAYENLAAIIYDGLKQCQDKEAKLEYVRRYDAEFMKIINAYYPDKFKYSLKASRGLEYIIGWFNAQGLYEKSLSYFNEYLKRNREYILIEEEIVIFPGVITALLHQNKEKEAEKWLPRIQELSKDMREGKLKWLYREYITNIFLAFVEYYGDNGNIAKGEQYAALVFSEYIKNNQEAFVQYYKTMLARKYLFFADEVIQTKEKELKTAKGKDYAAIIQDLAALSARQGKKAKARKYLNDLYRDKALLDRLSPDSRASIYEGIAAVMVEAGLVDEKTLEIAERAVRLAENLQTYDTLAAVYAALGNYAAAVENEKKAIELAYNDYLISMIKPNLEKYQGELAKK